MNDKQHETLSNLQQKQRILIESQKQLDKLNAPMPCGHLARYVYPPDGDEGTTRYCILCEHESWMRSWAPFLRSHGII